MKVSISWLKELVEIKHDVDELAEKLSMTGFEVESLVNLADQAKDVVIGFVEKVEKHPNAEKLKICSVNVGLPKNLNIVCGASNVRSDVHVLVAKVGAYLSSKSLIIKLSSLRGVESQGMICSLDELGIETNKEGIEILEENSNEIPEIGSKASDYLGLNDTILELSITANRPDGMSMVGIAREISAISESKLSLPIINYESDFTKFSLKEINDNVVNEGCIYTLSYIENINNKNSYDNSLCSKLTSLSINKINPVVDITNYLMLEQGQPLHAFDADQLDNLVGRTIKETDFGIRMGRTDEVFEALDNQKYMLNESISLITCDDIPIAIAGVIGGTNSSVTSETRRIWLEAAVFSPSSVRNSSREIGLRTDASSRYEKGISANMTIAVAKRAHELISDQLSANVISKYVNRGFRKQDIIIKLRLEKIHKILGQVRVIRDQEDLKDPDTPLTNICPNEVEKLLKVLGCDLSRDGEDWDVIIPAHRSSDLIREIDLIEEIARLIGYDNFDSNMPDPLEPGILEPRKIIENRLRNSFAFNGFQEVVTSSLVGPESTESYSVIIKNPLLSETSRLRTNAWEEHLQILKRNISFGSEGCWIFELAKIYQIVDDKYIEDNLICGAITGSRRLGKWGQLSNKESLGYFEARGKLNEALGVLNIEIIDKPLIDDKLMHPGRTAKLFVEGKSIGFFGQIHPLLAEKYDLIKETYLYSLCFESLINAATRKNKWTKTYKDYPTVPSMERDIALIHSKKYSSSEVLNVIKKAGSPLLENAELIDRYEGSSIPTDFVSQAFRIRYRDNKKTLAEQDINPIHEKIRKSLKDKFDAELRS